jgi:hypothetical protein
VDDDDDDVGDCALSVEGDDVGDDEAVVVVDYDC